MLGSVSTLTGDRLSSLDHLDVARQDYRLAPTVHVVGWTFLRLFKKRLKFNPSHVAVAIGIHLKNESLLGT